MCFGWYWCSGTWVSSSGHAPYTISNRRHVKNQRRSTLRLEIASYLKDLRFVCSKAVEAVKRDAKVGSDEQAESFLSGAVMA
jgi:hypothetical protein